MFSIRFLTTALFVTGLALPAAAQELTLPAPSSAASVTQRVGVTDIAVTYSSPGVKGRKVFGDVVKMGELWRTGANNATTIEFSTDVKIGKSAVPAGKYAIFSIPPKRGSKWTVIFNSVSKQGGTRSYDPKMDVATVNVKATKIPSRERLAFIFSETTDAGTRLDLEWAKVRVSVPITVDTAATAGANLAGHKAATAGSLIGAARYMAANGDVKGAMTYYNASLMVSETWIATWLKAELLASQGDYKAAYPLAERAQELGAKADYFFWQSKVEAALKDWKSKK